MSQASTASSPLDAGAAHPLDAGAAHGTLLKDGFVRLRHRFSKAAVRVLEAESSRLLAGHSKPWSCYVPFAKSQKWGALLLGEQGRNTNFLDFVGESPQLDEQIDALLGQPEVKKLLTRVLGPGYRIWYAQIRRAEVDAKPLRMHQDKPGEVGLGIQLCEVDSASGTTVFIKGSHLWPRLLNTFPFLSPNSVRRFLSPAIGSPGDCYLFYNCTWHGAATAADQAKTAIILTFLPKTEQTDERVPPPDVLAKVGPHLRAALEGTTHQEASTSLANDEIGPDQVVGERVSVPVLSPWRLLMPLAGLVDASMAVYRRLRK